MIVKINILLFLFLIKTNLFAQNREVLSPNIAAIDTIIFEANMFLSLKLPVKKQSITNIGKLKRNKANSNFINFTLPKYGKYINIYFEKNSNLEIPNLSNYGYENNFNNVRIYNISYLNRYTKIEIPINEFSDIYNPIISKKKIKKKLYSPISFISLDKKRIYIYLIFGLENKRHEVVWIFEGNKYLGRIINKI
jgi:hypothetical protein